MVCKMIYILQDMQPFVNPQDKLSLVKITDWFISQLTSWCFLLWNNLCILMGKMTDWSEMSNTQNINLYRKVCL